MNQSTGVELERHDFVSTETVNPKVASRRASRRTERQLLRLELIAEQFEDLFEEEIN